jgi:YVTN family beta-propeller protein
MSEFRTVFFRNAIASIILVVIIVAVSFYGSNFIADHINVETSNNGAFSISKIWQVYTTGTTRTYTSSQATSLRGGTSSASSARTSSTYTSKIATQKDSTTASMKTQLSNKEIQVQNSPYDVAYNNVNNTLYVTNAQSNTTSVINASTNQVVGTIPVGGEPTGITYDPFDNAVYVANTSSNSTSVISCENDSLVSTVPVGAFPVGIMVDPVNDLVYVANSGSAEGSLVNGTISVIQPSNNSLKATIPNVGAAPWSLALDQKTNIIYVSDHSNRTTFPISGNEPSANITMINGTTNNVISQIAIGSPIWGLAFDTSNSLLYATSWNGNSIFGINTTTNQVLASITAGFALTGLTYDSSQGLLYVVGSANSQLFAINTTSNSVEAVAKTGPSPQWVILDPQNEQLYVTNTGTDTVSVIPTLNETTTS